MPCVSLEQGNVSSGLLSLFCGDGKRYLVVMEAFLDESGTHKGAPILGVGSWVGAHWQWKKFISHWGDKPFHAKDAKCEPLKQGLFEAIQFGELKGFTAWMEPQDYVKQIDPIVKSQMGNAYAISAFACALGICKYCLENKLGKVAFVVEAGQPNVDWIRRVLEHMQNREWYGSDLGIASVAVATKEDFVQLCTADFLAHSRTSSPKWFERLYDSGNVFQEHITAEKLARISDELMSRWKAFKRGKLPKNEKDETPQ
jgi:hypothetical protein